MSNILKIESINVHGAATTKDVAIREAGALLVQAGAVTQAYVEAMFERETSVSTYMGNLLAIPHGTNEAKGEIIASAISVVRYDHEIDWDGNPVRFVIGIAGQGEDHLSIISQIAILFSDEDTVEALLEVPADGLLTAFSEEA